MCVFTSCVGDDNVCEMRCGIWLCAEYAVFFFFKQKTAYEMRISDWSSDVCSSDLGYRERGVGEEEAERRAWATVNKMDHGGKKNGSGRGVRQNKATARKGGHTRGAAAAARPQAARVQSATKAAEPRLRNAGSRRTNDEPRQRGTAGVNLEGYHI